MGSNLKGLIAECSFTLASLQGPCHVVPVTFRLRCLALVR